MKRAWLVAGIIVLAAACSNNRDEAQLADRVPLPEDLPLCTDLFQNGATVDPDTFGRACRNEAEEMEVPRYADITCKDGGTLMWNGRAWGYKAQEMTLFAADDPIKMPQEEIEKCQGTSNPSPATTAAP